MNLRLAERTAWSAAALALLAALAAGGIARFAGLLAGAGLVPLCFLALFISVVVGLRIRLARAADEEARDAALARQEEPGTTLFEPDADAEPFSAARARDQFERHAVPWIAPVLGLALLYWMWNLHTGLPWDETSPVGLTISASLAAALAFLLFLTSRFLLGLARTPEGSLLRGPGIALGVACWGAVALLAGAMATHYGWSTADPLIGRVLVGAGALFGLENLLSSLLALYASRRSGPVTTYESRIAALAVAPALLTRSVSDAIDYQFGFTFTQTSFFKVVRRGLVPFVAAVILLLLALSCLVFIAPHEVGIRERFGRPLNPDAPLESGFHLKAPWPVETLRRVPARRLLTFSAGFEPHADGHRAEVMSWSVPHYAFEDVFVVASAPDASATNDPDAAVPVSLISVNVPVEYRITNAAQYAYRFQDPDAVLRPLAYRVLAHQFATRDLAELLGPEREAIAHAAHTELQRSVDALGLGIHIEFLGLLGVHPPVPVADAFQAVVGALEEKEAAILEARAYTNQVLPLARAYAYELVTEATAQRHRRTVLAEAEAGLFAARAATAAAAPPGLYRGYRYLETLERAVAAARLYLLDLPGQGPQTLWLNLEEKPFSGVLDLAPIALDGGH